MAAEHQLLLLSLLLLLPILLALAARRIAAKRAASATNLPPSPPTLPIIGNLHQIIGGLLHVNLATLAARHGPDVMLLRLGNWPTLVISSSDAADEALRTNDAVFASRPPFSRTASILMFGGKDFVLAPYGDHWRNVRKLCTVHLFAAKKVQSFRRAREEEVLLAVASIRDAARGGKTVDMSEVLSSYSNDVICRAVSGKFHRKEGRNKLFRRLIEQNVVLLSSFNPGDFFPSLGFVDAVLGVGARAAKTNKQWDELLEQVIGDHEARPAGDDGDFVDTLLALQEEYELTRDHVKAILIDMFGAGTDTMYIALEWAMAELVSHPEAMRRLQQELRSVVDTGKDMVTEDDIAGTSYLKAVIKEALRLHPPAPLLLPHESIADCRILGYSIPKGTRVFINAWAMARDPRRWVASDEFFPERFAATEMDFKGKDMQFIPFGSGRRICPAMNLAVKSIELMLANLVCHFDWELPPGVEELDMREMFGLTVRKAESLLLLPRPASSQ